MLKLALIYVQASSSRLWQAWRLKKCEERFDTNKKKMRLGFSPVFLQLFKRMVRTTFNLFRALSPMLQKIRATPALHMLALLSNLAHFVIFPYMLSMCIT